ncbi:hypothetical protein [Helicobacter pylori]|nr:hypothetical protein [Helicobacter pylori]
MPLPLILGVGVGATVGYGVKKMIDACNAARKANKFIKKAESLKKKAIK